EVDLAEPDTVHAPGLGHVGQLEGVVECRDRAGPATHLLDEEPEMHGERSYTTRLPRLCTRSTARRPVAQITDLAYTGRGVWTHPGRAWRGTGKDRADRDPPQDDH